MPMTPPRELIRTTRPRRSRRMSGNALCTTRTAPQKLVSICALASATEVISAAPARPQPAQATTASSRSPSVPMRANPAATEASLSTSMAKGVHPPGDVAPTAGPEYGPSPTVESVGAGQTDPADAPVTRTTGLSPAGVGGLLVSVMSGSSRSRPRCRPAAGLRPPAGREERARSPRTGARPPSGSPPFRHRRFGPHGGPHGRRQFGHDGQAQARPLPASRTRSELKWRSKTSVQLVGGMPGPSSPTQMNGRPSTRPAPTVTTVSGKGSGVLDQVGHHLAQPIGVSRHPDRPGRRHGGQLDTELGRPGPKPSATWPTTAARRPVAGRGEAVGVQPGQVEQVLDQSLETTSLAADDGPPLGRIVGRPVDHRLGVAPDRGQRRPQLMGDATGGTDVPAPGPAPGWRPWC